MLVAEVLKAIKGDALGAWFQSPFITRSFHFADLLLCPRAKWIAGPWIIPRIGREKEETDPTQDNGIDTATIQLAGRSPRLELFLCAPGTATD